MMTDNYWTTLFEFTNFLIKCHLPEKYWGSREWEYCMDPNNPHVDITLSVWTPSGEFQADYVLALMEASQVRKIIKNDVLLKRSFVEKISLN